jgi:hypothetical protein
LLPGQEARLRNYWLNDQATRVLFLAGARDFFFHSVQTGFGTHPAGGRKSAYELTLKPLKNIFTDRRKVVNLCI